ncbi:hypothetical protein ILUMI_07988 [Ignelater luminosus]|uniref:Tetratricopeptide SHNi-TPR domain-containing protein n=1 Tax=Ignelater luminosus TaxID=2038154 RepID=A0A8K0GFU1_IGNLU|nr:hypothetical protein ILUMI_07988 [Ignelater luminosus]
MADVSVDPQNNNAEELVNLGIKAYLLRDYNAAVAALSRAIELMVQQHGEKGDPLGRVYLYYGKALLEVSREEAEPLGDAVARELDSDSEDGEPNSSKNVTESDSTTKAEKPESEKVEEKPDEKQNMNGSDETKPDSVESDNKKSAEESENQSSTDDNDKNKIEENAAASEPQTSSTVDEPSNSGDPCTTKEAEDGEPTDKADEEPSDLQLAWEILELAKLIFEQRADVGKKELADTLVALGEVSMESENFESAIADIKQGLEIQKQILTADSRNLAETYYKLALALSNNNQFDEAIENFNTSLDVLKKRIENLKVNEEQEKDEIKNIEALIPEIEEKIADIKSYKEETANKVASVLAEKKVFTEAETAAGSSDKQANDISHLVKRKRKLEDIVEECEASNNPNKKQNNV